jgi:ATP-dependent DNA ligase
MIATKKDNYYEFPEILVKSKTGKFTSCTIYCGMIRKDANVDVFKKLTKPEEISNIASRIKDDYNDDSIITDNVKGFIVIRGGYQGGKISFKAATFILIGTNMGRSNQRNVWGHTLDKAQSKYNDKNRPNESPELFRPMLANGEAVSQDLLNGTLKQLHLDNKDNYLIQYKYDGHRMVCRLSDQFCYSRTAEQTFISDELKAELKIINYHIKSVLPEYNNMEVYLDGEYYKHGASLQAVSSAVRGEKQSPEKSSLVYCIFDVPTTLGGKISEEPCVNRIKCISKLRQYFQEYNFEKVLFVKSWLNPTYVSLKKHYATALGEGYEGLMFKICDKPYEPSHNNYHSKNMIKVKQLLREEFLICGYKTGKGKEDGKIVFTCCLTDETIIKALTYIRAKGKLISVPVDIAKGSKFSVRPKLTDEESKQLYQDVVSETVEVIGKLYTVEFRDWSDKLLPQQPVGIALF